MRSFVDAGGWIAIILAKDQYHAIGTAHFQSLLRSSAKLATTDFVLDEVITRLRYNFGHRKAVEFLDLVHRAEASGTLEVKRIDDELWMKAEAIFRRFDDARLSFTDCTSFALLRELSVDEVFGFDSHFEMMGFVLQPK